MASCSDIVDENYLTIINVEARVSEEILLLSESLSAALLLRVATQDETQNLALICYEGGIFVMSEPETIPRSHEGELISPSFASQRGCDPPVEVSAELMVVSNTSGCGGLDQMDLFNVEVSDRLAGAVTLVESSDVVCANLTTNANNLTPTPVPPDPVVIQLVQENSD